MWQTKLLRLRCAIARISIDPPPPRRSPHATVSHFIVCVLRFIYNIKYTYVYYYTPQRDAHTHTHTHRNFSFFIKRAHLYGCIREHTKATKLYLFDRALAHYRHSGTCVISAITTTHLYTM